MGEPYLLLLVGVGGFLGAACRYLVAGWAGARFGGRFPYGTLVVNITGSFLLGVLVALAAKATGVPSAASSFLATGVLGSYTTFSTLSFESLALLRRGSYRAVVANLGGSVALGILAATLGVALGRTL
jgi:CrcB protein